MGNWSDIIKLGRFHFLIGGLLLFLFGALSVGIMDYDRLLMGYLVVMVGHLSISYSNEYFDRKTDMMLKPTLFSGGTGVLVKNPRLSNVSFTIGTSLTAISLAFGVFYIYKYGLGVSYPFFLVLGNAAGWVYHAPPYRLVSKGLGEVLTALSFGIILPGLGALSMGSIGTSWVFWPSLVMLGFVFILAVELPDEKGDRAAGKMTFMARYGEKNGLKLAFISAVLASVFLSIVAMKVPNTIQFVFFSAAPIIATAICQFRIPATTKTSLLLGSLGFFLLASDIWFL